MRVGSPPALLSLSLLLLLCCLDSCSSRSLLHGPRALATVTRITSIRAGRSADDGSDSRSVSTQLIITNRMRDVLINELKYLPEEVDEMDPKVAAIVIERGLSRPAKGMPKAWRRSAVSRYLRVGSLKDRGRYLLSALRKRWQYLVLASLLSLMAGKAIAHRVQVHRRAEEMRKLPTWQLPDYDGDEVTDEALAMVIAERILKYGGKPSWFHSTLEDALKAFKKSS